MGWWDDVQNAGQTAIDQAGDGISQVGDWLANKTKTFHTDGYAIDPNAYVDPNAAANKTAWGNAGAAAGARGGPTIDGGPQDQFRSGQMGLVDMLQKRARGEGPSIADAQNQAATDRSLSAAAALNNSGRGAMNPALAARNLGNSMASINRDSAQAAIQGRLAEAAGATDQLGNALATGRSGDIGLATNQANLKLQQGGMNDEMKRYYAGLAAQADQSSFAAQQAQQQLEVQNALGAAGINAGAAAAKDDFWKSLGGAGASGTATVLAAPGVLSDERLKKDVQPGGQEIYDFLDALKARDYRYKDPSAPGAAPGPQTGVMAQDLEKSKVGSQLVHDTPAGKVVDTSHGLTAALAAMAKLHERVKTLEAEKKGTGSKKPEGQSLGRKIMKWLDDEEGLGEPVNMGVGS